MSPTDVEEETVFLEKTIKALQRVFTIDDSDANIIKRHFSRWRDRLPQHKNIQVAWARYMQGIYGQTNMLTMSVVDKQRQWEAFLYTMREVEIGDYTSPPIGYQKTHHIDVDDSPSFGSFGTFSSY
jgi:hypothetical protein